MRLLVGRAIGDGFWIEDDDVREVAGSEPSAFLDAQRGGGQRRELPDRLFERNDVLVAHVFAQQTREVAVRPRVRAGLDEHAFRRHRGGVRPEAHPWQLDLPFYVVLGHQEVHHLDAAAVFDDEVHRGVLHGRAAQPRDLAERLAGIRSQCLVLETHQQRPFGARGEHHVLPDVLRSRHVLSDARADGRILETFGPRFVATLLHPRRHGGIETGRARRIRVHVGGDLEPVLLRRFNLLDRGGQLGPVRLSARFQVVDLGADVRVARNRQRLVDRLEETVAFAAHVRDVHPAGLRRYLRQLDELVGFREQARHVDQRGGEAHRAFVHRLPHVTAHALELVGGRRAVVVADLVGSHSRSAHERRHVRRGAQLNQVIEILPQRGPGDVELDVALPLFLILLHLLAERAHRALAEHRQRHALPDHSLRAPVGDEGRLGMIEHVDEAGRDGQTRRVDLLPAARGRQIPVGGNPIGLNGEVLHGTCGSSAVVDGAVSDDEVVLRRGSACRARSDHEERQCGSHRSVTARGTPAVSIIAGGWMSNASASRTNRLKSAPS